MLDAPGGRAASSHAPSVLLNLIDIEKFRREEFPITSSGIRAACSTRESRVRFSPHFYYTDEEVDRLVSCL
jgi:selenocysteine lyase/cysteine desulfurase